MKTATIRNVPENVTRGLRMLSAERTKSSDKYVSVNELMVAALTDYVNREDNLADIKRGGYYVAS